MSVYTLGSQALDKMSKPLDHKSCPEFLKAPRKRPA